eukprot:4835303-Amphidinium_carterae.1
MLAKVPSTVMAKAKAVHNFVVWVRGCGGEVTAFKESDAFQYYKHLATQRSYTATQSFTSALNFGAFVLGWDCTAGLRPCGQVAVPRDIGCQDSRRALLFTDGAVECEVPLALVDEWSSPARSCGQLPCWSVQTR